MSISNKKQELEEAFYKIHFDSKDGTFKNISEFEKLLKKCNFNIKSSSIDLIYFDDADRKYQDSGGIRYTLKVENRNFKEYFFNVEHLNGSSYNDERRIYCEKGKDFEDYSD